MKKKVKVTTLIVESINPKTDKLSVRFIDLYAEDHGRTEKVNTLFTLAGKNMSAIGLRKMSR